MVVAIIMGLPGWIDLVKPSSFAPQDQQTSVQAPSATENITNGTFTGVAVNAVSNQRVNIPVVGRDDTGAQIATDAITLAANGHYAFTLVTDKYPATANIRGTIEFDTPTGAQIGALGIRIPAGAAHTYTTLPALANVIHTRSAPEER